MPYRLGVDLGTTFTVAAVAAGSEPTVLGLGNRALQIPSVLFLRPDGQFLVGDAAQRRGVSEPDRLARDFKRRIGDHVPIMVAGKPFSPQTLTAHLLRWVVDAATMRMRTFARRQSSECWSPRLQIQPASHMLNAWPSPERRDSVQAASAVATSRKTSTFTYMTLAGS